MASSTTRIKIFVISEGGKRDDLIRCLESLSSKRSGINVIIFNNCVPRERRHHEEDWKDFPVPISRVIHNAARPSFLSPHPARTWNLCIMHAFVSLKKPECDVLIVLSESTVLLPGAISEISEHCSSQFDYLSFEGEGRVQVFTPEGIKKIGMYDEIFISEESAHRDYITRALKLNRDRISINHHNHKDHNSLLAVTSIMLPPAPPMTTEGKQRQSEDDDRQSGDKCFTRKWEGRPEETRAKQHLLYPYFELDIYDLKEKYHTTPFDIIMSSSS